MSIPPTRPGEMVSVVVPVYNEQETIPELYRRITASMEGAGISYEVVFMNDGSRDQSLPMLRAIAAKDSRIKVVDFARNFGHQIAISAGMDFASGDAVVVMDGDLQDPPEVIPRLVAKWREGTEVVYAVRTKRRENVFKRAAYKIFGRLMQQVSSVQIPLDSGDFSLVDRRVADLMRAMPERNRFVRGIRSWVGFRQTSLEYERDKRFAGEVKYTFTKLVRFALDGIFSFSYVPLKLATYLGFLVSSFSFLLGVYYIIMKLTVGVDSLKGWASTIVVILFLGGVQLLTVGIIGEYIGRIYDEVKKRPLYIVNEQIGFTAAAQLEALRTQQSRT